MNYFKNILNFKENLFNLLAEKRCVSCNRPFIPTKDYKHEFLSDLEILTKHSVLTNKNIKIIENFSQFIQKNLCLDCAKKFRIKAENFCHLCGDNFNAKHLNINICGACIAKKPPWDNFYHITSYEVLFRELIIRAKFNNSNVALKFFGSLLAHFWLIQHYIILQEQNKEPELLIPVPLHKKRLKERGYNQCTEMGKYFILELEKHYYNTKIKLNLNTLTRYKYKPPQSLLKYRLRMINTKNIFKSTQIQGKHILLLDDVATTNSTLIEAAICLKNAGAKQIDVLIIAKA